MHATPNKTVVQTASSWVVWYRVCRCETCEAEVVREQAAWKARREAELSTEEE